VRNEGVYIVAARTHYPTPMFDGVSYWRGKSVPPWGQVFRGLNTSRGAATHWYASLVVGALAKGRGRKRVPRAMALVNNHFLDCGAASTEERREMPMCAAGISPTFANSA